MNERWGALHYRQTLILLSVVLAVVALAALCLGRYPIGPGTIIKVLFPPFTAITPIGKKGVGR